MANLEHNRRGSPLEFVGQFDAAAPVTPSVWRNIRQTVHGRESWGAALIVIVGLSIWEWQVRVGHLSALFFPAPTTIGKTLATWIVRGTLWPHVTATFGRMGGGFALGASSGILLGLLIGWLQPLRRLVDPLLAAIHPLPKIALLPLVMIFFGIGEASKIALVAISAFFPLAINTMTGVSQIHPLYFEVLKNSGAGPWKVLMRVVIPGSLPLILTGVRLALNMALTITLSVELVSAQQGLGALIWLAWQTLRTEELYASLVVIALLGMALNWGIKSLTRLLLPWQDSFDI